MKKDTQFIGCLFSCHTIIEMRTGRRRRQFVEAAARKPCGLRSLEHGKIFRAPPLAVEKSPTQSISRRNKLRLAPLFYAKSGCLFLLLFTYFENICYITGERSTNAA